MRAFLVLIGIAVAHLKVRTRQTIVASLGVTVGVGIFLAASGMMVGSQNDFVHTLINSAPHIIVKDERRGVSRQPLQEVFPDAVISIHGLRPRDEVRGLKDWPAMLDDARALPGAIVAPSLSGAVSIRFAGRTEPVALDGIDPRIESQLANIEETLYGGHLTDLEQRPDGIIITRPLAQRLGANLGDTLVVSSTAGVLQRMRILALINPDALTGFYAGDNTAYGLLRTAQVLFARPNIVNQLHIKLADPYSAEAVAARLEAHWGYTWQSWQERSRDILGLLVARTIITYAVVSAVLLVATFGVYTGVSTSVNDKRRDIAILRAMGFTQGDIEAIFVFEGMAVGAMGAVGGFLLGSALLELLANAPITLNGQTIHLPLDRSLMQYAVAGGVCLIAALVAAWLPARKAAHVDPVDILRGAA
jgi:lipoprotein-releasing system permease protein